jgi:flagellar hook-length control protein FliK
MSAATALPSAVNASAPGAATSAGAAACALPTAGSNTGDTGTSPATTFQLLIAGLGTAQPPNADPVAPAADTGGGGEVHTTGKKTVDANGSEGLSQIEALAALCAWQLPVAPAQAPQNPAGEGANAEADAQPHELAISAVSVEEPALDALDGRHDSGGDRLPVALTSANESVPASTPAAGADATLAALRSTAAPQLHPGEADPQLNALVTAVSAETTPMTRQKAATSAVETLLSQVDAAGGGNLLRMPVVSSSVTRTVPVPVHDPRWPEAVATQVRWAVADGVQSATLKMVPEHLGPVELHIELRDNQVNVNFGANQAETRQALQDSLPRLREVLAGAGITLGQANVQQQSGRASQSAALGPRLPRDEAVESVVSHTRIAVGLIDLYA